MSNVRYDLLIRRRLRADAVLRFRHRPELVEAVLEFAVDQHRNGASWPQAVREGRDAIDAIYRMNREHDHGPTAAA